MQLTVQAFSSSSSPHLDPLLIIDSTTHYLKAFGFFGGSFLAPPRTRIHELQQPRKSFWTFPQPLPNFLHIILQELLHAIGEHWIIHCDHICREQHLVIARSRVPTSMQSKCGVRISRAISKEWEVIRALQTAYQLLRPAGIKGILTAPTSLKCFLMIIIQIFRVQAQSTKLPAQLQQEKWKEYE